MKKNNYFKLLLIKIFAIFILVFSFIFILIKNLSSPRIFTKLNPGIPNGGLFPHSKFEISFLFKNINYYLKTNKLNQTNINLKNIKFPVIVKPDKGLQGIGVRIIYNNNQLKKVLNYAKSKRVIMIIQQYCKYPKEIGLYFYRTKKNFVITGITEKTSKNNIIKSKDYIIYKDITKKIDNNKLISKLDKAIPKSLNYGRLDLKIKGIKSFSQGDGFKIIEFNSNIGAMSLHGYDFKKSFKDRTKIFYLQVSNAVKIAKLSKIKKMPSNFELIGQGLNFIKETLKIKKLEKNI